MAKIARNPAIRYLTYMPNPDCETSNVSKGDVMMLDLDMPGELDGLGVIERLRQENYPVKIIVFTAYDTDERIVSAVQAGVEGYLLKGVPRDELFRALGSKTGAGK